MLVPTGPIAFARRGWGLKGGAITSVVAENSEGMPEVLCAQMICGAAFSGVRVLVLLPGGRGDDLAWQAIGNLLGGGDKRLAAEVLNQMSLRVYASGTGQEHAPQAGLVYAPGLSMEELKRIRSATDAAVLTLSSEESGVTGQSEVEVIRVGGDFAVLDSEGVEVPMIYDSTGPIYRPVIAPLKSKGNGLAT